MIGHNNQTNEVRKIFTEIISRTNKGNICHFDILKHTYSNCPNFKLQTEFVSQMGKIFNAFSESWNVRQF